MASWVSIEDKDFGKLPLAMTPSGGARNPFELYVYAARVDGLKPGFYHYGALAHDLGLVRAGKVDVPEMLGDPEVDRQSRGHRISWWRISRVPCGNITCPWHIAS